MMTQLTDAYMRHSASMSSVASGPFKVAGIALISARISNYAMLKSAMKLLIQTLMVKPVKFRNGQVISS